MKLCMGCMNQIEDHISTCPYCGFDETKLKQESYYLNPGSIVGGKYIIGRVISYGGYTISYLGMDAELNHKVIIKEYLPSDFSTRAEGENEITIYSGDAKDQFEQGLTNFLNEANRIQALSNLRGIAKVYDCIAENDTGYVISEYVQGETLKSILDSGKKFSVNEAKSIITKILQGLSKVHSMDIIHCDISPETIVVTDSGEVKLLDFGATRYVTTANSKSLAIILKQGYAPEEQYRSQGVRGPWTDIYALGAVMYHMITGVVPQESVERALVDELKEPSKLGITIPENIENALMNALNVYQSERTPSAEVFLNELNSPAVKRIKVKKKNNEIGKFPTWAKILVACLFCIIVGGGVAIYKIGIQDTGSFASTLKLEDFAADDKEYTIDTVDAWLDKQGYDIEVLSVETYNSDATMNGKIYSQSIEPTSDLESDINNEKKYTGDLYIDNGKVKGTLTIYINRSDKIKYSEIRNLTAYALAIKMDKLDEKSKRMDDKLFQKSTDENGDYFEIMSIEYDGKEIPMSDIRNSNDDVVMEVDKIEKIYYCASEFFFWDEFDLLEGGNINTLGTYPMHEKKNENSDPVRTERNKSLKGTNLVDDDYYTFENYDEGYILKQTREAGSKVDTSEGMDEPLLLVVGKRFVWNGKTGYELKQELEEFGFDAIFTGSENGNHIIEDVEVFDYSKKDSEDREKNETLSFFKKEDGVRIEIKTKEPVTQAPATRAPATQAPATQAPATQAPDNDTSSGDDGRVAY